MRGLIKENVELRGWEHRGEVSELKDRNSRIQNTIDYYKREESPQRESLLEEENTYLRSYIAKNSTERRAKPYIPLSTSKDNHAVLEESVHVAESKGIDIENAKKYITNYVNTIIDDNDEKLVRQQRYIDTLEARLAGLERNFQHYEFERDVKLTKSMRKSHIAMAKVHEPVGENEPPLQQ